MWLAVETHNTVGKYSVSTESQQPKAISMATLPSGSQLFNCAFQQRTVMLLLAMEKESNSSRDQNRDPPNALFTSHDFTSPS